MEERGIFHRLRTVQNLFLLLYDTRNVSHPCHLRNSQIKNKTDSQVGGKDGSAEESH